ncbi:hypothetical protein D3C85_1558070 [compost metagenome]
MAQPLQRPLELEVQAHVAIADRQAIGQQADGSVQRAGHQLLVITGPAQRTEWRVTGKQLVGAVTPQGNRDMAPRVLAQQAGGQQRAIRHWLVQLAGNGG